MDFENNVESAEMTEVAEPSTTDVETEVIEEGAEEQELTEPVSKKTEADTAFAEMRRKNAELERQIAELQKLNKQSEDALGLYFQGDNKAAQAVAHYQERPVEQVLAEMEMQNQIETLKAENEQYKQQAINAMARQQMADDLKAIQVLDPKIKSLEDLGDSFAVMRFKGGLSVEEAYFATMAKKQATERKPAEPIGKINKVEAAEKDYYTRDEVIARQNDKAWINKNYEKIQKSMQKWKS